MGSRLADLAKDILEDYRCFCFVDDLPQGESCPCGGDGRVETNDGAREGNDETETCWHCQAREALADEEVATKALEEMSKVARRREGEMQNAASIEWGEGDSERAGHFETRRVEANVIAVELEGIASRALATARGGAEKGSMT